MKHPSLAAAGLLLVGLVFSPASLAHDSVHTYLGFGHGPVQLGVDLGHFFNQRHARRHHQHSPRCYRSYSRHHGHWGHSGYPQPWQGHNRRDDRHHGHVHANRGQDHRRKPHHGPNRGHARPSHANRGRHQHSRDCHLHYERGHAHWK